EVNVNRVIPAAAVVDEMPDLARAEARRRGDAAVVGVELLAAVDADRPRTDERGVEARARLAAALPEDEGALAHDGDARQIRIRDHDVGDPAVVRPRRVTHHAELEEPPHARILRGEIGRA